MSGWHDDRLRSIHGRHGGQVTAAEKENQMTQYIFAMPVEPHTSFDALESESCRELRAKVREFAWTEFESRRPEVDEKLRCREYMPVLAEHDLIGTLVSTSAGGTGEGLEASSVIAQELGGVIPALAALRGICGTFVGKPLEEFGTAEQVDQFLRPLLKGTATTSLAITEPATGSDVASLTTRAVRDGSGWILNGKKKHISGACEADFLLVYAVTAPDAPVRRRMTAFLVPADSAGLAMRAQATMGLKGLSHAEVDFDNVRLDDFCRLGDVGDGLRILFFTLTAERIDIAARALGCATRAFEEARAFSAQRGRESRPIRYEQAISHRIADMRTTIDAGRLLVMRAARLYDQVLLTHGAEEANRVCDEEAAIAKLFCGTHSFAVCDDAMQIFGGLGYENGTAVEAMFRDSRVFRFGGGTDEIQRHIIQREEYRRLADSRR
jgi:alkylation response protein AidB-like acyl-CoA dehydrogenase